MAFVATAQKINRICIAPGSFGCCKASHISISIPLWLEHDASRSLYAEFLIDSREPPLTPPLYISSKDHHRTPSHSMLLNITLWPTSVSSCCQFYLLTPTNSIDCWCTINIHKWTFLKAWLINLAEQKMVRPLFYKPLKLFYTLMFGNLS